MTTEPRIREAAVIGLPDDYYGEIVCACVIPHDGMHITADEVQSYLSERLAAYKVPSRVELMTEFPLNAMGKVQKNLLREQYAETFN